MQPYELSDYQFKLFNAAINSGVLIMAIEHPSKGTATEKADKLASNLKGILELIELGLLEDVSEKFKDMIESVKIKSDVEYSVIALTKDAYKMFSDQDTRAIN